MGKISRPDAAEAQKRARARRRVRVILARFYEQLQIKPRNQRLAADIRALETVLRLSMRDWGEARVCSKCGDTFSSWDQFQRHPCVMGALSEAKNVKSSLRRERNGDCNARQIDV